MGGEGEQIDFERFREEHVKRRRTGLRCKELDVEIRKELDAKFEKHLEWQKARQSALKMQNEKYDLEVTCVDAARAMDAIKNFYDA